MTGSHPLTARWPAIGARARALQKKYAGTVRTIGKFASQLVPIQDEQLAERADRLRDAVRHGVDPLSDDLLPVAFALVADACRRARQMPPYEEQILAGLALANGAIAEMQTGEGKTLAAAAPAFLHSLSGKGVHVATVNQYLADRDYELLKPVFEMLGVSVGALRERASPQEKRAAYACDVTYGPGYEFGFDYLRDQLALLDAPRLGLGQHFRGVLRGETASRCGGVQRGHAWAIIDEIDSVLIDEARTPLVVSGSADGEREVNDPTAYQEAERLAQQLTAGDDYTIDEAAGRIYLAEAGVDKAQRRWQHIEHVRLRRPWPVYVEHALQARLLLKKDVDYVVAANSVHLVDESTGRIFTDRSWRDGLHQAVEVKEGLPVTSERVSLARISRQRYYRLYHRICGMTGTGIGSQREFWQLYRLPVVPIPLRIKSRRLALRTRCFADQTSKWVAVVDEVAKTHGSGQPVLIGTRSIQNSERLAAELDSRNLPYRLLNGKQDEDEARIVAQAGQVGVITVATNMAGRGTDIQPSAEAIRLGGLHVVGTERHESIRIDRQLIGRAARQGDPGSCQFFVSADDDLIRVLAPQLQRRMKKLADRTGEIHVDLTDAIRKVQRQAEKQSYAQRCQLLRHDRWLEEVMETMAKDDKLMF